jgi:protein phosphatase PTC1
MSEITPDIQTDTQTEAKTNSQTDIQTQNTSIHYKVGFAQDRNKKYRRTMEDAHSYFTNFNNSSEQGSNHSLSFHSDFFR